MKPLSIDPVFMPGTVQTPARQPRSAAEMLTALRGLPFATAYDTLRVLARDAVARGEVARAISTLSALELHIAGLPEADTDISLLDIRAAVMQIITALYIELDHTDQAAASAAAATLNLLASKPKRKDVPFLEVLGSLLYDIAYLHSQRGEYKQAEREMEKSIKVFERLGKIDSQRYAATMVAAVAGATTVYNNRVKQAELLAHYQAATTTYTRMVAAGIEEATDRLVESLANEGDTLARMGKHREASQYYTRALKYLQRLEPEAFSERQLRLSVSLGEEMLHISAMRDKAIHLLNTMLHKAHRLNSPEQHERISALLEGAKSTSLDILNFWHKIFPK